MCDRNLILELRSDLLSSAKAIVSPNQTINHGFYFKCDLKCKVIYVCFDAKHLTWAAP